MLSSMTKGEIVDEIVIDANIDATILLEALVDNGEAHEVGQFGLEGFSEAALILFLMALGHCMYP